jgi:mono/diheme cytochrome c family protein
VTFFRWFLLTLVALGSPPLWAAEPGAVDFARDVRPILSRHCFSCHGPDANNRKSGLRLDTRDGALGEHKGTTAFVPGNPSASESMVRILATDPDDRMPPPDKSKGLTEAEIETVTRWVKGGAVWKDPWSLRPVLRIKPPRSPWQKQNRSPIDAWVHARLQSEGMAPARIAAPSVLVRRLALDLTGLPPTPDETARFVNAPTDKTYRELVEHFLASPAYGERWARVWLDLARYADTKGYEKDMPRTIWPYRDWVIAALSRDMPFDAFTVAQLAGDLLPGARPEQLLATAFHRNTMTNDEGGTDDEEFRVAAVKDRVDTTMQVWMGLTAGCAKCHDHKYDPISLRDYYGLFAFFDQTADADRGDEFPKRAFSTKVQSAEEESLLREQRQIRAELPTVLRPHLAELQAWRKAFRQQSGAPLESDRRAGRLVATDWGVWYESTRLVGLDVPGYEHLAATQAEGSERYLPRRNNAQIEWREQPGWRDGKRVGLWNSATPIVARSLWVPSTRRVAFAIVAEHTVDVWLDGEVIAIKSPKVTVDRTLSPGLHWIRVRVEKPDTTTGFTFTRTADDVAGEPAVVAAILLDPKTPVQNAGEHFLRHRLAETARPTAWFARLDSVNDRLEKLRGSFAQVPVLLDLEPGRARTTRVHQRGDFLNPGDTVTPAIPTALGQLPKGASTNRLGLARWLVSPENPLTARVLVNRYWAQFFGRGLVETEEDFGAQGSPPTHPELLDHLASEFMRSRWSLKSLCRTIVMSHTYRQDAAASVADVNRDRWNRMLARGPRFRLEAEMVRDSSLAVSGLLSRKTLGPPVMPLQPDGIWKSVYSELKWKTSEGEDRHRRGLYTFFKRTSPYPSMTTFDAPSREICSLRRIRSNTPLQALVTLNDPVFVEAAQALAREMLRGNPLASDPESWIRAGFLRVTGRNPVADEVSALTDLYGKRKAYYEKYADDAKAFSGLDAMPVQGSVSPAQIAALTAVANVLLNLDEFLTKG